MIIALPIPDELVARLAEAGDLSRRALEAFGLAEFQAGRLTESDVCQLLGLSRYELDGFLKARGIFHDYTPADLGQKTNSSQGHSEGERRAADDLVARFKAFRAGKTLGGISIKELITEGRR